MTKGKSPSEEVFLKEVANHEIHVLLDNGVYRHLRFKQPTTGIAWFDIVTWPGHLAYAGDMGSFVFARLDDMFRFFRTDRRDDRLGINLSYWGEKLQAVDRDGRQSSHTRFCEDRLRERVEEVLSEWIEDFDGPLHVASDEEKAAAKKEFEEELRQEIEDSVFYYLDEGEYEARKAVNDFSWEHDGHKYEFSDTWEWSCDDYTYRFVWCCYAIAWSIKQYDALTPAVTAAEAALVAK